MPAPEARLQVWSFDIRRQAHSHQESGVLPMSLSDFPNFHHLALLMPRNAIRQLERRTGKIRGVLGLSFP
jgi:hypothetical protein